LFWLNRHFQLMPRRRARNGIAHPHHHDVSRIDQEPTPLKQFPA
jgi:hypothetical protein